MINLSYEFKLKPTRQQARQIERTLETCCRVYNYALRERKDWINSRKSPVTACSLRQEYIIPADAPYPNYNIQAKNLTRSRKNNSDLQAVHSQVLQQVLKGLDKAFSDMSKRGFGFPRFKKKIRSFLFPQLSTNCLGKGKIKVPQLGWIKIRQSRPYPKGFGAKQARIVKKASGHYVVITFQSPEEIPIHPVGEKSLGLDAGISSFLATSAGEEIKCPQFLRQALSKLKLLQRRLKHKKKGSNNWLKLQNQIGKIHESVANTRKDWHCKLAHKLCDSTDNIFVEDINFKSWSRGIVRKPSLDSGIGQFINEILPYVCWKRGKYYRKVNKDKTSQICPNCDKETGKKALKERKHHCPYCHTIESRDIAAAKVIKKRGLSAVGRTVLPEPTGKIAYGGVLSGNCIQLSLFDLNKYNSRQEPLR